MAKTETKPAAQPGDKAAAKKGKGLIIGLAVAVVAAAGGGGAAYWKFGMSAASAAPAATASPAPASAAHAPAAHGADGGMVAFEPFLVNLADDGGQSYLRTTLTLLVASEEVAKELETKLVVRTRIRSSILEALSTSTADQLLTPEGKDELKQAIIARIASLNLAIEVTDVLFTDFVVQR